MSGVSVRPTVRSDAVPRARPELMRAGERVAALIGAAVDDGYPAGATLLIVDADGPLIEIAGGSSCLEPQRIATTGATIYDLASLTKVLATVPLCLALAQRGRWSLDDPLARWLPEVSPGPTTLRQLLTHTSGLPPHRPFYLLAGGPAAVRDAVCRELGPGLVRGRVIYSDLGYMLLGWALERCSGEPLDALFDRTVAGPLGMARTRYRPPATDRPAIAAAERDGDQRPHPTLVWGEVHDGNAWALDGVAGHAGLFGPAADLGRFASRLLAPEAHPVLSEDAIAEMTRRQAGTAPDVRGLGWRLEPDGWGSWPPGTYWHTGFTGTSLLIAPGAGLGVVLLSGGVHPRRRPEALAELRRRVHLQIAAALR